MPRAFYASDLSVSPPSLEISAVGVYKIPFTSDSAATAAACRLTDLATMTETATQPTNSAIAADATTVTVDAETIGLERGKSYELAVDFSDADETWTGVLVLVVVA